MPSRIAEDSLRLAATALRTTAWTTRMGGHRIWPNGWEVIA